MSDTWIAVMVLPLVFFVVILMECSRLHCARLVQRHQGAALRDEASAPSSPRTPTEA